MTDSLSSTPTATLVTQVERDLLNLILIHVKDRSISTQEAQDLAREFLSLLPMKDQEELLVKLNTLRNNHPEVTGLYVKYAGEYEEDERSKKLSEMSMHLKNGDLEKSLHIVKGGVK